MKHLYFYKILFLIFTFGSLQITHALEIIPLTFHSSHDGTEQKGLLQVPDLYNPQKKTPLLVWVQGMYRKSDFGIENIGVEANRKGWLLLTADMHGERTRGETNLGAPSALQDLIDALDHVVQNYPVDTSRVYLAGISMGGLTGGLTLAKAPERFAAGALLLGITDLADWYRETLKIPGTYNKDIVRECGGTPEEKPDEYARRSVPEHAKTLAGIPMLICHGRLDMVVPVSHSDKLVREISKHRPADLYVYWTEGGHSQEAINEMKILDFLGSFSKKVNP
jgi:dipeptidyl aminopeptidase/acylaminoacyl peptidase